jgi:hypothetical protein
MKNVHLMNYLVLVPASGRAMALGSNNEILFNGIFTGLSGWLNGIRNMEIFQPSFHDQRIGTRACYPLIGTLPLIRILFTSDQMNKFSFKI